MSVSRPKAGGEPTTSKSVPKLVFDVAVIVGLAAAAFVTRRTGLPTDGLWFDDAWVAVGAIHMEPGQVIVAGSAHPGFTLLLRAFIQVGVSNPMHLTYFILLAGSAGPPVIYLYLRYFRYPRSVCTLLAAALVVAHVHLLYSGRLKGYVLDSVLIVGLVALATAMAPRRWGFRTAAGWVAIAVVLGSLSGYLMVMTALAAVLLVLHPNADLALRLGALAVQGCIQFGLFLASSSASDVDALQRFIAVSYDGHVSVHADPSLMLQTVLRHLGRIAEVYPGVGGSWGTALMVVSVGGLVLASIRPRWGREAFASRLALSGLVFAFLASTQGRFPFGPSSDRSGFYAIAPGGRHTLWMVPLLALGLAIVFDRIWRASRNVISSTAAVGLQAVAGVAAAAVLVAGWSDAPAYPTERDRTASRMLDEVVDGEVDRVFVIGTRVHSYALWTQDVNLEPTPDLMVGYSPRFGDRRFVGVGEWSGTEVTDSDIEPLLVGAETVVVYGRVFGPASDSDLAAVLVDHGFVRRRSRTVALEQITTWNR